MKSLRLCTSLWLFSCLLAAPNVRAEILRVPAQYPNIQYALIRAAANDTVLVAPGTCYENIVWPSTRGIHLLSEAGRDATTIDGMSVNSVIRLLTPQDSTTVVRGFTIAHGTADFGAGMYCIASSPLITDCRFTDNQAMYYGGGFYCEQEGCAPTLRNDIFFRNVVVDGSGGGLCAHSDAYPIIMGGEFRENRADAYYGGAIHCEAAAIHSRLIVIADNAFYDNSAGGGGAVSFFNPYPAPPDVRHNTFSGNRATLGGALYTYWSLADVSDCRFLGNRATVDGGAICTEESHELAVRDCELIGNEAAGMGGAIALEWWTTVPQVTGNTIRDNRASGGGAIYMYFHSSPTLRGNQIRGNTADSNGGAILCWRWCSPLIEGNVISGNGGSGAVYMVEAGPTIQDNIVSDNGQGGLYFSYVWSVPQVHENAIFGHVDYGLVNMDSGVDISAEDNWWGDATGPYHPLLNPGGQGNRVSDHVLFQPWWTDPGGVSALRPGIDQPLRIVCAPNPFRGTATITCGMPEQNPRGRPTRLAIYDIAGRELCSLPLTWGADGLARVTLNGSDETSLRIPTGVHWAKLDGGNARGRLKLICLP